VRRRTPDSEHAVPIMTENGADSLVHVSVPHSCPMCGGEVRRIRRRPADRVVSVFRPVIRCECRDRECGWNGLIDQSGSAASSWGSVVRSPAFLALAVVLAIPPLALLAWYLLSHATAEFAATERTGANEEARVAPSAVPERAPAVVREATPPGTASEKKP
jgi:hypothetical protein